jgi:hypothetical protein
MQQARTGTLDLRVEKFSSPQERKGKTEEG